MTQRSKFKWSSKLLLSGCCTLTIFDSMLMTHYFSVLAYDFFNNPKASRKRGVVTKSKQTSKMLHYKHQLDNKSRFFSFGILVLSVSLENLLHHQQVSQGYRCFATIRCSVYKCSPFTLLTWASRVGLRRLACLRLIKGSNFELGLGLFPWWLYYFRDTVLLSSGAFLFSGGRMWLASPPRAQWVLPLQPLSQFPKTSRQCAMNRQLVSVVKTHQRMSTHIKQDCKWPVL